MCSESISRIWLHPPAVAVSNTFQIGNHLPVSRLCSLGGCLLSFFPPCSCSPFHLFLFFCSSVFLSLSLFSCSFALPSRLSFFCSFCPSVFLSLSLFSCSFALLSSFPFSFFLFLCPSVFRPVYLFSVLLSFCLPFRFPPCPCSSVLPSPSPLSRTPRCLRGPVPPSSPFLSLQSYII